MAIQDATKIDTRTVIDAKEDITLIIKNRDIESANLKCPGNCAAAKAVRRQLKKECRIHISRVYIKEDDGQWYRYITPNNLRTEIISFDRGGSFIAGEYKLIAPVGTKSTKYQSELRRKRDSIYRNHNKKDQKNAPKRKWTHVQDVRTGPASGI